MELRTAQRKKARIRLGLSAISGGGKTYSALLIAKGLCGDWSRIAVIDSENGSADLYAHLGGYNVLPITAPFTPEKYVEAIKACEKAGMEVIIIDSISHEWSGKGGCLEIVDSLGGKFQNWAIVTPRHQAFVEAILQSPCHVITTVRRKQDYEITKDTNGKVKVEKAGLSEVTRSEYEYELTANLNLDITNHATASKDRTGLFAGKAPFVPSEETGRLIAAWCEQGVDAKELVKNEITQKLEGCNTQKELVDLYNKFKTDVDVNPLIQQLISDRRSVINGKTLNV